MIVALWPKGGLAPRALITMMRCPFGTNRPWYRHRRAPCGYRTEEQELHLHSQGRYLGFDGSFVNKNEPLFVVFPADYFGVGQKRVHFGKLVFGKKATPHVSKSHNKISLGNMKTRCATSRQRLLSRLTNR